MAADMRNTEREAQMTTESIGNLIAALAKAQAKFKPPTKNKVATVRMKEGGTYQYRYSDLADLIDAVRGPLSENELAYSHCLVPTDRGTVVCTILGHSSGETIKSEYLIPQFQKQQEFGSALTYARRYALSGLLGVAADDDDDSNSADASDHPRPQTNGATRTVAAPPPERMGHLSGTGKVLPQHPEESAEATRARQRIKTLIDQLGQQIKTAPNDHALDLVMDDGRDALAEIEKAGPAGIEAANKLRARANARISELRGPAT